MPRKSVLLMAIPLFLSAFTHLWNPIGFPIFHIDEGYYMERTMDVLKGFGPLYYTRIINYDHPYFGQLFMAGVLGAFDYSNFVKLFTGISSIEMAYLVPRVLMGLLAIVDTFLLFMICDRKYNRKVGFLAAVLFAVMPITWLLRSIWLENILLPLLLSSILLAIYTRDKEHSIEDTGAVKGKDKSRNNKIEQNKVLLVLLSGTFLGLAIFTKETVFTIIPLVGILIFINNKRSLKALAVWFIPVILIPLIWPASALYLGNFDKWLDGIQHQTHRISKPLIDTIISLFVVDPVLSTLAFSGLVVAGLRKRKDGFIMLWIIPFLVYAYLINFVSLFHFILIIPVFCISAAIIISAILNKIGKKMFAQSTIMSGNLSDPTKTRLSNIKESCFNAQDLGQVRHSMLAIIFILAISLFGLVSTTMLITLNLNYPYFQAVESINNYLPDKNKSDDLENSKVTVLSRERDYIWIPKYLFDKDQHDYQSYSWNRPIETGKYLIVVDDGFRGIMLGNDEMAKNLRSIYNTTTQRATFERNSEYYGLYKYPYTSINDREVLGSLGIASGTKAGKVEIRTNYYSNLGFNNQGLSPTK